MLEVGIDGGNNTVITAIDGDEAIIIPTILAPYRDYDQGLEILEQYRRPLKEFLDAEVVLNYRDERQKKEFGRFYVGEYAKEMEGINITERKIGKDKFGDRDLLVCMLVSLAVAAAKARGKYEGEIDEQVRMVTGLPFLQYKKDRENYAKQFLGCHKVIFRGSYSMEVVLDITDVQVVMEGAEALKKLILNDLGEYLYREDELIDRTILGVEIGEFTSEIIALTFMENEMGMVSQEYKLKLCMGIDLGIANAKQPLIDFLREKYNTVIDRYDIDNTLKRKQRRGDIDLDSGKTLNIIGLYEENLKQLADSIYTLINNRIKNAGEKGRIKHILLYGGGVCVLDYGMGNFLKSGMEGLIGGVCSIVEEPQSANAKSYLERAIKVFSSLRATGKKIEAQLTEEPVKIIEQNRLLYGPGMDEKKEATMPLKLLILKNGTVWEAKTVRGAVAAFVGNKYLEHHDKKLEWEMRVQAAKEEAQKARERGLDVIVHDSGKGIIEDNEDLWYETSHNISHIKIRVENERLFLLSLVEIGSIKILERKDTFFFRFHQKWNVLSKSNGALQCCSNCLHRIYVQRIVCPVYNLEKEQNDGRDCGSYTIYPGTYLDEYEGGEYVEITDESPIEVLYEKLGQYWIV